MNHKQELMRAVVVSGAVLLGLAAAAFWPSQKWTPPPRPPLKAPIVFDELLIGPSAPSDPGKAAEH